MGCVPMNKPSPKLPDVDFAELLVFGFIIVTTAIVIGSLCRRYLFG